MGMHIQERKAKVMIGTEGSKEMKWDKSVKNEKR